MALCGSGGSVAGALGGYMRSFWQVLLSFPVFDSILGAQLIIHIVLEAEEVKTIHCMCDAEAGMYGTITLGVMSLGCN